MIQVRINKKSNCPYSHTRHIDMAQQNFFTTHLFNKVGLDAANKLINTWYSLQDIVKIRSDSTSKHCFECNDSRFDYPVSGQELQMANNYSRVLYNGPR